MSNEILTKLWGILVPLFLFTTVYRNRRKNMLMNLVNSALAKLTLEFPHLEEPVKAFTHYLIGKGKDRELPDSLIEELHYATAYAVLERGRVEVGDSLIIDYRHQYGADFNLGEDDVACHLLKISSLGLTVGGFTTQILNIKGSIINFYMEDVYDWHTNTRTHIPVMLNDYLHKLPNFLLNRLGFHQEFEDDGLEWWWFDQATLNKIGKSYKHYKYYSVNMNEYDIG